MTSTCALHTGSDRLAKRLDEALTTSPHLAGRKLGYETEAGHVILRGTVRSYFQKQMAQEAVRRVDGVEQIDNRLEVDWS